jgi:DEAD/DEAH box helicase domain-containing protein
LPEEELHTSSYWFTFDEEMSAGRSANDMQHALLGIANVLSHLAPLYLMCDPMDIRVVPQVRAVHNKLPTVFFYDRYPGGVGLSDRLYEVHGQLMDQARSLIESCGCISGCPACVGPIEEVGLLGKKLALELLAQLDGGAR